MGWLFNTRKLLIVLPITKGKKWKGIILKLIDNRNSPVKEVEYLIRKLVCIGVIIPGSNAFIKPLR